MLVQNNLVKLPYKLQSPITQKISYPTFKSNEMKPIDKLELGNISPLESGLAKLDKITKKEYDSLSEKEKIALRTFSSSLSNYGHSLETDLRSHYFMTNVIKTSMDKQFGAGNYVIIPIGRSLSSVGKLLELQIGKDSVKNIPLSNIGKFYTTANEGFEKYVAAIDEFTSIEGFNKFKKYLSSIGLDKETVENSGKNYVIIDYAYKGDSIKAAYDILTCEKLLGNTKQNICAVSINDLFGIVRSNRKNDYDRTKSYILEQLEDSRYKPYSIVGRLNYTDLKDIKNAIDYKFQAKNYLSYEETVKKHKAFGFMLLDTEFSGKEKPYQQQISFLDYGKKYKGQKNYLWKRPIIQLFVDVKQDTRECYKVMNKLKKTVEMLQDYTNKLYEISIEKGILFQNEFKEINEIFDSLRQLSNQMLEEHEKVNGEDYTKRYAEDYYFRFRPMLYFKLKELRQKFSAENIAEILELMERRFNQLSKNSSIKI